MIRMIRMTRRAGGAAGNRHQPFFVAARVEFLVEFRRRLCELRELRSDCSDSCRLRRAKARTQNIAPLSLEGVSQMDSILPERLLALVRPAFDLVLQRSVQACGCKIMTPRYAVWQNAQQLPLFLHPQRKPWLAFLVGFWLAWLGFWLVWLGSWLAFWLVWFGLLGFWLVWFGSWLAFWLVWLAFWLVWLGFLFFPVFFSSPCRNAAAGHFASISRGHYFAATRLRAAF